MSTTYYLGFSPDGSLRNISESTRRNATESLGVARTVANVAALASLVAYDGQEAVTQGRLSVGDGGGNVYTFVADDTTTHDGGFYIDDETNVGRWVANDRTVSRALQFGSIPDDDSVDNSAALLACANAAIANNGRMEVDAGVHYSEQLSFTSKSNLRVSGPGTIKAKAPRWVGALFDLSACTNFKFEGVTLDTNMPNMATVESGDYNGKHCVAIAIEGASSNVEITKCTFLNLYENHIRINNASDVSITGNLFKSTAQNQGVQCDFIGYVTGTKNLTIDNNRFLVASVTSKAQNPGGILISGHTGGRVSVSNNYFENVGRDNTGSHRVGTIDFYSDVAKAVVTGNNAINNQHGFLRLSATSNTYVARNYADTTNSSFNDIGFVQIGTTAGFGNMDNIVVEHNTFVCTQATPTTGYCFNISSTDWERVLENVRIENNTVTGFRQFANLTGPFDNLKIKFNDFTGAGSSVGILWNSSGVSGTEANGILRDFDISHNTINVTSGDGVSLPFSGTFTGTLGGRIAVNSNYITASASAINVNNVNHEMLGNTVKDCARGMYPRGAIAYSVGHNTFINCTIDIEDVGTTSAIYMSPFSGTGSPEGVVRARVGALYTNRSGGAGTTLYVKESGTSNTGWAAV